MSKLIGIKPSEAAVLFSPPPTLASVAGELPALPTMLWKGTAAQARGAVLFHSQLQLLGIGSKHPAASVNSKSNLAQRTWTEPHCIHTVITPSSKSACKYTG